VRPGGSYFGWSPEKIAESQLLLALIETFWRFSPLVFSWYYTMGEPLCQEKMPAEIKKPLRITLTLTTKRGDVGSLDPLWQLFLSQRMFEIARRYRASARGKSFGILSDQADLSISFPDQGNSAKTFALGCVMGSAVGLILFRLSAAPLLWVPVMGGA
jgi:hypothetical protein